MNDKLKYIIACAVIAVLGALGFFSFGLDKAQSLVVAFGIAILAGLVKETYDVYKGSDVDNRRFNFKDILADIVSAIVGSSLWALLCTAPFNWTHFLYYIIGVFALLVFIVIFGGILITAIFDRKEILPERELDMLIIIV